MGVFTVFLLKALLQTHFVSEACTMMHRKFWALKAEVWLSWCSALEIYKNHRHFFYKKNKSGWFCVCRIYQQSWSGRSSSQLRFKGLFLWKGKGPMSMCTPRGEWWETGVSFIRFEQLTPNLNKLYVFGSNGMKGKFDVISFLLLVLGLVIVVSASRSHVSQKQSRPEQWRRLKTHLSQAYFTKCCCSSSESWP